MDRRRNLLKIAALRSERERQEGVNTAEGGFITSASELKAAPCSIQCVFIPRSIANQQVIFSTSSGSASPRIELLTNGALWLYTASRSFVVSNVVLGTAYDVVFTLDDNRQSIYLNGELLVSYDTAPTPFVDYTLGLQNTSNPKRFDGDYLLHRHFNYALSAEEVAALYNDGDPAGYVLPGTMKDLTPVEIIGENSHTWTGVDDPVYSYAVRCSRYFKIGEVYKMRVTISDYEAGGAPFFKISTVETTILSGFNGDGTYELYLQVNGTPYQFVYVYAGSTGTDRRLTITVDSIEPVGCVAEYLPQNLVGSPLGDPVEIIGENSHTWTGVDDSNYSHIVRVSRPFAMGRSYKIRLIVSDWEAGNNPFIKIGTTGSYYLPNFNGNETYEIYAIPNGTPYSGVYVYAGLLNTDRRMTITVDSVELIPEGVALSWLDSAKQFPLNDEYLPPLLQSDGGHDLTASGAPQIIIK